MRANLAAVLLALAACSSDVDEQRRARELPVPLVACKDIERVLRERNRDDRCA